jgi:hypothetical protein
MYLRFGFTPPTNIPGITHGFIPSVYMFERIELIAGNTTIDTLYPEFMNIYYNVFTDFSKKKGNTLNTGPLYINRDVDAELPDSSDEIFYNTTRNYSFMLPFYFSMKSHQSFPLCALTRQELVVRIHMRKLSDIVQLPPEQLSDQFESSLETVKLTHFKMDIEYVYLGNQEFKSFMQGPKYYTYTQTQEQRKQIVTQTIDPVTGDETTNIDNNVHLEITGPVVELFMYILHNNKLDSNRVDKYEEYNTYDGHSIQSINLELDGSTYIDETIADSVFLSQLQYLLNHSSAFENNTSTNNMYVYNYSFSENPEECCPHGTVNFNVIKNKLLRINLPTVSTQVEKTLFVLARTINILRINDGTAEIIFKNVA